MIKIVPARQHHLDAIRPREPKPMDLSMEAITFLHNDEPIAIVGWYLISPGVLQVWSLISDGVSQCPIAFHKSVRLLIEHGFERFELRRMQMSVRLGFGPGWKWAKALGFNCEGVMKKYGTDGSDYWLFARVA